MRVAATRDGRASWKRLSMLLPLAPLLVVYTGLAVAYQRTVPLLEGPDEPSHLHYAAFLSVERRLPLYGDEPEVPGEGMQPPLVYVLTAPLLGVLGVDLAALLPELRKVSLSMYGLDREAISDRHAVLRIREQTPLFHARWPSAVFGLLTVAFTFLAALRACGDRPLAVLTAGLVALNPQFLFVSGYLSNDTAAAAIGAAAFWLVAAALGADRPHRRHYLLAALLASIGILTKNSTLPGIAVAGVTIFWVDRRPLRDRLTDAVLASALLLLLAGPYLAWRAAHQEGLFGLEAMWRSASGLGHPDDVGGAWLYLTRVYWDWTFESYWGRFGWMTVRVPKAVYLAFIVLTWTGVLGFLLAGRAAAAVDSPDGTTPASASMPRSVPPRLQRLRAYLAAVILANLAAHVWLNVYTIQAQGRHLFPVAPEIACVLAMGIAHLTGGQQHRTRGRIALSVLLPLSALAIYCLRGVIVPAYR